MVHGERNTPSRGQEDPTSIYSHAQFFSFEDDSKMLPSNLSEVRFGLYVGSDEFQDFDTAMRLERHLEVNIRTLVILLYDGTRITKP